MPSDRLIPLAYDRSDGLGQLQPPSEYQTLITFLSFVQHCPHIRSGTLIPSSPIADLIVRATV